MLRMTIDGAPLQPLSARSVVISLLLGLPPGRMSPAELARAGRYFGISASTMRTAVTRAVASGDLERVEGCYVLAERHVVRRRRQDEGVEDAEKPWDGSWEMAVVVVAGRPGPERAALREMFAAHRLAELREGVWTRPANLRRPPTYADDQVLRTFRSQPDQDPVALAAWLWDLTSWSSRGRALVDLLAATERPILKLTAAAHIVRHLTSDPLLPKELLPGDWPGNELRSAYADYQDELRNLAYR